MTGGQLQPWALAFGALTLVAMLALGAWAAGRTRDLRDFYVAGQSLGLAVTALGTMSAAFSGFVFLGGPGLTYRMGVAALFICLPLGFTGAMLCWVLAGRLRRLAAAREVFTVPDALLARFDSRAVSGAAAVAVLVGTLAYLGAQLQALALVVEAVFGLRELAGEGAPLLAMALGLAVVLAYSVAGGMVAGAWTDAVQGFLMMVAAVAVFAVALGRGGGVSGIVEAVTASPDFGPGFFDPFATAPVLTVAGFFLVFGVGTLGQPHMLHKFYMLDDVRKLRWMPLALGGSQLICVLVWLGIGLAVPALVASGAMEALTNPDEAAPRFLLEQVPPWLAGFVFAGVLAAVMSTADSFLNVAAAALVRDLPVALGRRPPVGLATSRAAVVAVGIGAALFSLGYRDLIALLGTFAFGMFGAALAPVLAVGFNWRRVSAAAALASIVTGTTVHLGLEAWRRIEGLPPLPLAPGALTGTVSFAASLAVLLIVSGLSGPQPLDPDLEEIVG